MPRTREQPYCRPPPATAHPKLAFAFQTHGRVGPSSYGGKVEGVGLVLGSCAPPPPPSSASMDTVLVFPLIFVPTVSRNVFIHNAFPAAGVATTTGVVHPRDTWYPPHHSALFFIHIQTQ
ncbi:hypothetical protein E2C01_012487 [Portunus trituberculatus]|uniref:Uncharacterized protein n=1 Tax=Portunus trituberculatus TaxID=210409 RepID=A0A5B7DE46_PORTR|nr:hypothetical protein [Portunus trituberculatus]